MADKSKGSALLVPVGEWPVFVWSFAASLVWLHLLPDSIRLESRFGKWLMSWAGYYAYHPCHDGMSMAEVREIRAREIAQ